MYELTIRADDELEQFSISEKGHDDKFISLAIAVAVDSLYRAKCPAGMIGMMMSSDQEVRETVISTMKKCILVRRGRRAQS